MKQLIIVSLALALAGCHAPGPTALGLTADQASALARRLANERAQTLHGCQPFHDGPAAKLVRGEWVWHDRQGRGLADVEATVKFAADGTHPRVNVVLLHNMLDETHSR